jgi:hypothetical protein
VARLPVPRVTSATANNLNGVTRAHDLAVTPEATNESAELFLAGPHVVNFEYPRLMIRFVPHANPAVPERLVDERNASTASRAHGFIMCSVAVSNGVG